MGFDTLARWYSNKDVFNHIVGSLITLAITSAPLYAARIGRAIVRLTRLGMPWLLLLAQLGWILAAVELRNVVEWRWLFAGLALAITVTTVSSFWPLRRLGIINVHARTRDGVDFKTSLKMVKRSVDFLGIGADKLSSLPEFEKAMLRCASANGRARFLVSPPDNPVLERAARRNKVDESEYKGRVKESLHRIYLAKKSTAANIEIRFYAAAQEKDLQQFRLMFIDDATCLAGWTVWGTHIGKDNPQLVLRETRRHPDISAYKAFHDYFEAIWDDETTQSVDLAQFE